MSSSDQIDDPLHVESEDDQMDDIVYGKENMMKRNQFRSNL